MSNILSDFRNQRYVSDGNTYTLENKAFFIKRHSQVSVLVEYYAVSLVSGVERGNLSLIFKHQSIKEEAVPFSWAVWH